MTLLELLFALVAKFAPITEAALGKMESEGRQWATEAESDANKDKFVNKYYIMLNKEWYFRLLWAVLYVPLVKWLMTEETINEDEQM